MRGYVLGRNLFSVFLIHRRYHPAHNELGKFNAAFATPYKRHADDCGGGGYLHGLQEAWICQHVHDAEHLCPRTEIEGL